LATNHVLRASLVTKALHENDIFEISMPR